MTSLSAPPSNPIDPRSAEAGAVRRPRSAFWRAVERVAAVCTTGELGTLADHYQVGQPALAARFRAASLAAHGHRA